MFSIWKKRTLNNDLTKWNLHCRHAMEIQETLHIHPARKVRDMTVPTRQMTLRMTIGYLDQCLGDDA